MELIDNKVRLLGDDLKKEIGRGAKVKIVASYFSIYAFEALKRELSEVAELQFIFPTPAFVQQSVKDKLKKETREYFIPKRLQETSLYGTEFEIRLRNQLTQKVIARECAEWICAKVQFRSNITEDRPQNFIYVETASRKAIYMPIEGFTSVDLGYEKNNMMFQGIMKNDEDSYTKFFFNQFQNIWNDHSKLQDVTQAIVDYISSAYTDNSPEFIYFVTLYNIFSEFLDDIMSEDFMPNEGTGFKNSLVWQKLYSFQRDGAIGVIQKLEKYNGCILADSVGLGKTFTALAVMKYYASRNKNILVLAPKKLANNWNQYRDNVRTNLFYKDRIHFDVLYHTDLGRTHGFSNGHDLSKFNWDNYDLVVIDESHNFRNANSYRDKETRYDFLINKVLKSGVRTKVLMLSATPVNNRFTDLKNQLALAYGDDYAEFNERLDTSKSVDVVLSNAQRAFNEWTKLPKEQRKAADLMSRLDIDFSILLDNVTIARSRKHITRYYDSSEIGSFPTRRKPASYYCDIARKEDTLSYNDIFNTLMGLTMGVYAPMNYILPSRISKYEALYDTKVGRSTLKQVNREKALQRLMTINMLKRLESCVDSFRKTVRSICDANKRTYDSIIQGRTTAIYKYLLKNDYLDNDDRPTEEYKQAVAEGTLEPMPFEIEPMAEAVHKLVQSIYDTDALKDMFENGHQSKVQDNALNENFKKKEFQTLWNLINHRYAYTVEFDSEELIRNAVKSIDENLYVTTLTYTVSTGEQKEQIDSDEIKNAMSFKAARTRTETIRTAASDTIKYDLFGKIASATSLTRKTIAEILKSIRADKFACYKQNPEDFINKVAKLINEQKASIVVERVSYNQIEGTFDSAIFTESKATGEFKHAFKAAKHIRDYVFVDGINKDTSIERRFAEDLDGADEVCVYAKLPKAFYIPTPVGNYSPDWAIAFKEGSVKHIYFVAETKGSLESMELRGIEGAKIECAKKLYNKMSSSKVRYEHVTNYSDLLNKMNGLE